MASGPRLDYINALEGERAVELARAVLRGDIGKFKGLVQDVSTNVLEKQLPLQDLSTPFPPYSLASVTAHDHSLADVCSERRRKDPDATSNEEATVNLTEILFILCSHFSGKPEERLYLNMLSLLLKAMRAQHKMVAAELYALSSGPLLSAHVLEMIWDHDVSLMPVDGPLSVIQSFGDSRARECRMGQATCSGQDTEIE